MDTLVLELFIYMGFGILSTTKSSHKQAGKVAFSHARPNNEIPKLEYIRKSLNGG